jgi:D-alanine-D-alanine ligase
MRIGIFFGGNSREREVSFAGGRTVYDNLNKSLFEAVPIFVDSFGQLTLLDWSYLYKGSIRDFYPPVDFLIESPHHFQVYAEQLNPDSATTKAMLAKIGRPLQWDDLKQHIDFAFLALHGKNGEDGRLQGMLEWLGIPYSGSGIAASTFGIDKAQQKKLMQLAGFEGPAFTVLTRESWLQMKLEDQQAYFDQLHTTLGLPLVAKAANQGSSIGISVLSEIDFEKFVFATNKAFFIETVSAEAWLSKSADQRIQFVREFSDIRSRLGLPAYLKELTTWIYHPEELLSILNEYLTENGKKATFEALDGEKSVVFESFIEGQEFSCIVIQQADGSAVALPPTGIVKGKELFDYRSKYLPGLSRKITPIDLPDIEIEKIRAACSDLFTRFGFQVYARIDGFYTADGRVMLNDPNTTSGMMPSSFFFHQAAEIGLNPSQFLTYIIRTSLHQRICSGVDRPEWRSLLQQLDAGLHQLNQNAAQKRRIAVIMGGYSTERHISVESGRNIYEKLSSSKEYEPVSIFLGGSPEQMALYRIPINLHLKDNADDINAKIAHFSVHPLINSIQNECKDITARFAFASITAPELWSLDRLAREVDEVFIALHGRPGEDGTLQRLLQAHGLPFNGSSPETSAVTINKYETNEILHQHGIKVARHKWVRRADYNSINELVDQVASEFPFPIIAKPVDDGCSSAVKKLRNTEELRAYAEQMFRDSAELLTEAAKVLQLRPKEEFPQKDGFLVEAFIEKGDATYFLEVTGGMLTHFNAAGEVVYEVFEPSESLAEGEVLSLEEKFLAGEGLNITPARYTNNVEDNKKVSAAVRAELEKVARILRVEGYCRIDAFVKIWDINRIEVYIIEINSLPGMTPATCIFHQTALNGYKPFDFIDKIMDFGRKKMEVA